MKSQEKQKAIILRKEGKSLTDIASVLNISKSTASVWTKDVVISEQTKLHLRYRSSNKEVVKKRTATRLYNEEKRRQAIVDSAANQVHSLSDSELKIGGALLYWAEGGKTQRGLVRFSNSDPNMIAFIMIFFRKICLVQESKFRCYIHMYDASLETEAKRYWSKITRVPENQFFKSYVKRTVSGKIERNNLPFGTLEVYVCDTRLFLTIKGWVQSIFKHENGLIF